MSQAMIINSKDNVAVALDDLASSIIVNVDHDGHSIEVQIKQNIPFGHKFALKNIDLGQSIIKYGETIGRASVHISCGEHVHTHNVEGIRGRGDLEGVI